MPYKVMLGFMKKVFFTAMTFFRFNPSNPYFLECVPMNNQECKTRSEIINVNNNEPVFYPYSVKVRWNEDKCRSESKELIDKGVYLSKYYQNV